MVKELVGAGQHYRDLLEEQGFDLSNFGRLYFKQGDGDDGDAILEEELVLKKLACLPDFNGESWRVTNVINTDGSALHLLLVPKDCPRLKDPKYPPTGEMPNPNECYLVEVRNAGRIGQRCKVPVLTSDPQVASSIARRKFGSQVKVPSKYLETDPKLVTSDEWVEYCRHLILDKNEVLPDFITKYADLRKCQEEARLRRLSRRPSTILPTIVR